MKRTITFLLTILLGFFCMVLQGCGDNNSMISNNGGREALKVSELSIEDFEWETIASKHNGYDCYTFSLINNSDYDVIVGEITYKVRDDVTDSQLRVYEKFMKEHDGYIEETDSPRDVILRSSKNVLVSKGEQLTGLRLTVGFKNWSWYDYPTDEQFELMKPKELQIGVVGKDNVLYIAYYDFENKIWKLDENMKSVDVWSEKAIAQKISKPIEGHHVIITDQEDEFKVHSYGVTADNYNQYVEDIKKCGFEEKNSSSSRFEGQNADGYTIELWYNVGDERLVITIKES